MTPADRIASALEHVAAETRVAGGGEAVILPEKTKTLIGRMAGELEQAFRDIVRQELDANDGGVPGTRDRLR